MSGWDEGQVYHSENPQIPLQNENAGAARYVENFTEFLREFRKDGEFFYRELIRTLDHVLEIDLEDLGAYNGDLLQLLRTDPTLCISFLEQAAKEVKLTTLVPRPRSIADVPDIQVTFTTTENPTPLRNLAASDVSRLVAVSGIVISASKSRSKAHNICLICKNCKFVKKIPVRPGFGGASIPRVCDSVPQPGQEPCPLDPYQILPERCEYVDQQSLKLQELPESVPNSDMPRHILMSSDRGLVDNAFPGTRVTIVGIYSIFQHNHKKQTGAIAIHNPYIRVVGMRVDGGGGVNAEDEFSGEEVQEFKAISQSGNVYETLANSIAPSIFGSDDIKKAVVCLLMGGSRKVLPDNMRLRGDVNVLMLGDPSTAKSQMLKFVEKVAPICVYTSGKGSSAAGLTASVVRDPGTGEFFLEGGAMVLADGGVVCIDEFDKMREEDRVAIHEAMEQQTISIAKAGITTILNSRTSVLAAANPQFGRYDDMKSAVENIDFQSTILSRFDLIFVIKDVREEERDRRIASHVLDLHVNRTVQAVEGELDIPKLKRYISYCRSSCKPRIDDAAAEALRNHFCKIRQEARRRSTDGAPAVPITIRQLEAIVRITESLAKAELQESASERHVQEAIRLFKVSTLEAAAAGIVAEGGSPELIQEVKAVENLLSRRIAVGTSVPERRLIDEVRGTHSEAAVRKALNVMLARQEIEYRASGKLIFRKR